jgi:hypothetical protein
MKIIVKGTPSIPATPDQEFDIPDPLLPAAPYDDTGLSNAILALSKNLADLQARVYLLENPPAPIPIPIPTPLPVPVAPAPPAPPAAFRLYSPESFWNKKLLTEPVPANSPGLVAEVWENVKLAGVSVNTTTYSRPIYYVDSSVQKVPVYLLQDINGSVAKEILAGVRIPANVVASNGTDGHLCILDLSVDAEFDFWKFKFNTTLNRWEARTCGIIHNVSTSDGIQKRLSVWNPATATHLPLAGGTILLKELEAGVIPHCLAIALNRPKKGIAVWPAQTTDGWYTGINAIEEGRRFRFPANIVIDSAWAPLTKMFVDAIRDYGMVCMDKTGSGLSFYVEDPTQYGKDATVLDPYRGGKPNYKIFGDKNNLNPEFPWGKLLAF